MLLACFRKRMSGLFPPPPRWDTLLEGLELVVETTDSAGELAPDSWARLSRRAAVSPSVKLKRQIVEGLQFHFLLNQDSEGN